MYVIHHIMYSLTLKVRDIRTIKTCSGVMDDVTGTRPYTKQQLFMIDIATFEPSDVTHNTYRLLSVIIILIPIILYRRCDVS